METNYTDNNYAPAVEPIIIKLGGSIISRPNQFIDYAFLREFRDFITSEVAQGQKFVIAVGGGHLFREVLKYAKEYGNITSEEAQHWIGIAVNNLNAELVKAFFPPEIVSPKLLRYEDINSLSTELFSNPITFAAAFIPGRSADWAALQMAKVLNAQNVFDLKNNDGVYEQDIKTNPNAKLISKITWSKYLSLIGDIEHHEPGASYPVDAVAAKEAAEAEITYTVLNGRNIENLGLALQGQDFVGTVIAG